MTKNNETQNREREYRIGDKGESRFYAARSVLRQLSRHEDIVSFITDKPRWRKTDLIIAPFNTDRQKKSGVDLDVITATAKYSEAETFIASDGVVTQILRPVGISEKQFSIDVKTDERTYLYHEKTPNGTGNGFIETAFLEGSCDYAMLFWPHDEDYREVSMYLISRSSADSCRKKNRARRMVITTDEGKKDGYAVPVRKIIPFTEAAIKQRIAEDGKNVEYTFAFKNHTPYGATIPREEYEHLIAEWYAGHAERAASP